MNKNLLTIFALAWSASAQVTQVITAMPVLPALEIPPQPVLEKAAERSVQYEFKFQFAYGEEMKQACVTVPLNKTLVIDYVSSQARGWRAGAGLPTPLQGFPAEFTFGVTTNDSITESFIPYTQLYRWHPDYSGYIAGQQVRLYSKSRTKACAVVRRYTKESNAEASVVISGYIVE